MKPVLPKHTLSSGCTLVNLACSGNILGAFPKGQYVLVVGDSESGKTFITITCMAEAARTKRFDDYRFIYDNPEDGALMDMEEYFGKKLAERIEAPKMVDGVGVHSEYVEDFYYNIDDAVKVGKPFIYVLDSMDVLSSRPEEKKFQQSRRKVQSGKESEVKGSFGDGKAKFNSQMLRRAINKMKKTGSILIIISQTRDNIGLDAMFNPKIRSGGRSLKFYAALELWTSVKKKIKKKINDKNRTIGIICHVEVKKNRLTGHKAAVDVPMYRSMGIADTDACVQYLIDEDHWKVSRGMVKATEFEQTMTVEKLIRYIEKNDLEPKLKEIVQQVWDEILSAMDVKRKKRYE